MEQSADLSLCPYLRSRLDRTTAYAYPTEENRCYASKAVKVPSPDYQASFCLVTAHTHCPFCIAAEEQDKSPNDALPPKFEAQSILARIEGLPPRAVVMGLGVLFLLMLGFAIVPRLAANDLPASDSSPTETHLALVEGPVATPALIRASAISATPSPTLTEGPPTPTAIIAGETAVATSTREPTMTPLPTLTATPSATLSRAAPGTLSNGKKASPTPTSQATATPTNTPLYAAPLLLEPPDGTLFKRNTILRWSSEHALSQGEVFDVLVWPSDAPQPASIGSTTEEVFPIVFRSWAYAGRGGTFYWTIRIKGADGTYLSPAGPPLSLVIE